MNACCSRVETAEASLGHRQLGGTILNNSNYRVILKNGRYTIHEVYYDENGEPWTCAEDPVSLKGTRLTISGRKWSATNVLLLPVLNYEDLVPNHEPPEPDMEQPY